MKLAGEILLVSCYELGHQPLHLATLSARLKQAGYAPVCVDSAIDPLSDEVILQARFVAISVPMHTALRLGTEIAQRVRTINPTSYVCLYGLYALLNADYLLRETVDAAIGGEYEMPLLRLVEALANNDDRPVPGVRTQKAESGPWIERTPQITPERGHLPPLERYARLQWGEEMRVAGYAEATRGCKHTCRHCPITPIYHGRFFATPIELVLADIRAQVERGARHITFGDPDFWNGPTHALRIVRAMRHEFPELTFDATIKIEHLLKQHHLLPEMQALGCLFIVSAVESFNDTVLQQLDKGHTAEEAKEAFTLLEQHRIVLRPSLLPFSPWETLDSYLELLNFFEQGHFIEHIDPVHLSIRLLLPPGSALLDGAEQRPWLGALSEQDYSYTWQHPDPHMDELQERVAQLVASGESCKMDPITTFFQVKALALAARGEDYAVELPIQHYGQRKMLPHLSESWFCCAEPPTRKVMTPKKQRTNLVIL